MRLASPHQAIGGATPTSFARCSMALTLHWMKHRGQLSTYSAGMQTTGGRLQGG
jgi:hypothetical protein